jgi:prepilin-type processing-associated H-X9-DG protein
MGLALKMYVEDNRGCYPYFGYYQNAFNVSFIQWPEFLKPYYPLSWTSRDYHCPGYKFAILTAGRYGNIQSAAWWGSYGYNGLGSFNDWKKLPKAPTLGIGEGVSDYDSSDLYNVKYPSPISESAVKAPSEMLAMADSRIRKFLPPEDTLYRSPFGGETCLTCGSPPVSLGLPSDWLPNIPPHGRNLNSLFCDGRVAGFNSLILLNPTNSALLWNRDHEPHPETW